MRQVLTTSEDNIFLCSDVLHEKVVYPQIAAAVAPLPTTVETFSSLFPSTTPLFLAFQLRIFILKARFLAHTWQGRFMVRCYLNPTHYTLNPSGPLHCALLSSA